MQVIREVLPDDGIVVDEVTQVGYIVWYGYPSISRARLITSGFSGTLGYGFPTALGVKVANPDRPVVSVTRRRRVPVRRLGPGDGDAVRHQPRDRGGEQRLATATCCATSSGSTRAGIPRSVLHNPDFQAYARSFGVPAWRVENADGLRGALREAIASQFAGNDRSRLRHHQGLPAVQVPSAPA